MRSLAIVGPIVCLTGCRSLLGIEDPTVLIDASTRDAAMNDGAPGDGSMCFGSGLVTICPMQPAQAALVVSMPTTLLTDDLVTCDLVVQQASNQPELCVLLAQSVTINATLRAIGTRSLVIVSETSLTVTASGIIDVSSYRTLGGTGAGSSTACAGTAGTNNNAGSGGGAGGSFGSKGGNGGAGDMMASGGIATAPILVTTIRGGCGGGTGGSSAGSNSGGIGGRGGGSLYLIAGAAMQIDGALLANGAGGSGGQDRSGGGGGGSGGLIGLDAPDVRIGPGGVVQANGGGGGSGGAGATGGSGGEPSPAQPLTPAPGAFGPAGSSGGDGAAGSIAAKSCGPADDGGGGGGGGGGVTLRFGIGETDGAVSPPFAP